MLSKDLFRVGIGFDVHRFTEGRPLILGGVTIPYPMGLLGHSDADVLLHALSDACLGAVGRGDIGQHFPDTDPSFKGMDSGIILSRVVEILAQEKAEIVWIDAVVITESPKILPHVPAIKHSIAVLARIPEELISIKGKTTEGLGFTGRKEGIAVQVAVTVRIDHD